jgi:hypothetical protein
VHKYFLILLLVHRLRPQRRIIWCNLRSNLSVHRSHPPFSLLNNFVPLISEIATYFQLFHNDKPTFKLLVTLIYVMEVIQTILTMVDAFRWFGSGWGDFEELNKLGMSWFSLVIWGPISKYHFSLVLAQYCDLSIHSCVDCPDVLCMENLDSVWKESTLIIYYYDCKSHRILPSSDSSAAAHLFLLKVGFISMRCGIRFRD